MTAPDVGAAILAGGRARRFGGRDKCRLIVEGRAIIVRQIDVLQRVAGRISVIASDPERFADLDVDVRPDLIPDAGAVGGIYTALASSPCDRVIVVACDLPFLDARALARLVELTNEGDGAWVRSARGVEPLLACYRTSAAALVKNSIEAGRMKAADLGATLRMKTLEEQELSTYGPVSRLLANLNTPEDLARVQ